MNATTNEVKNETKLWPAGGAPETKGPQEIPEDSVRDDDKRLVYASVDKAYELQYGTDGIEALKAKIDKRTFSISEEMRKIAFRAVELAGKDIRAASAWFKALCKVGEFHLQSKFKEAHKEATLRAVKDIIPSWASYKSGLLASMAQGLDPTERDPLSGSQKYPTLASIIEAGKSKPEPRAGGNDKENGTTVLKLTANKVSERCRIAMQAISQNLDRLTAEEQEVAAPILENVANTLATLHRPKAQPTDKVSGAKSVLADESEAEAEAEAEVVAETPKAPSRKRGSRKA